MEVFDLIILGGGSGAFAAAIRANELKAKTALINGILPIGGTCVNVGCVPSKTLLYAGEVLHQAQYHSIPGIEFSLTNFDFHKVIQDELSLVERLRQEKYENTLKNLEYVNFYGGKSRFIDHNQVEVNGTIVKGKSFIIATGSTTTIPPIQGIQEVGFITHIEALKLKQQPRELLVVGAGSLGLEYAQMYARFGTKVTIIERGPSIFSPGEQVITQQLAEILAKEGIIIKTYGEAKSASKEGDKKVLACLINGKEEKLSADEILLATGKTANTHYLELDKIGIQVDKHKAIVVNQFFQTTQNHIFAIGDVANMPLRLETTAAYEGTLAAENALTDSKKSIDYSTVPYTIFTDPQLAGIGFTEDEYIKKTGACDCRTISFKSVPKAIIIRRTEGMIKMIINPKTKQIIGVHILAPNAGDLIGQAMVLIRNRNSIDDVIHSLPVFPTLSEAIKIAALSFTKDISKLSCCI